MACVAAGHAEFTSPAFNPGIVGTLTCSACQVPPPGFTPEPTDAQIRALCAFAAFPCGDAGWYIGTPSGYAACPVGEARYCVRCYDELQLIAGPTFPYQLDSGPPPTYAMECTEYFRNPFGYTFGFPTRPYYQCYWEEQLCKTCEYVQTGSFTYDIGYFSGFCCPPCSAGQCWCEDSETCVTCDPEGEDCAAELNAEWDPFACEVTIDDPDCGEGTGLEWDWESCACAAPGGGISDGDISEAGDYAVSIAELSDGTFVRVWRVPSGDPLGDPVYAATSRDRGATWTTAVQINPGIGNTAGPGSWPQIIVTRNDVILVFWHDASGAAGSVVSSEDQGTTWNSLWTLPAAWRFPTAIIDTADRVVLVVYNSTRKMTEIYQSFTYFTDLNSGSTPIASGLAFGKAPASILLGRAGEIAVFFTGGSAAAYMKYTLDGGYTWSHGTQIDTGRFPVAAMGVGHGLMSTANAGRATESTSFLRNDGAATIATRITQINSSTVWLFRGMLFSERDGRFYRTFRDPTLGPTTQYFEDPNFTSPSWEYCV